MRLQELFSVLAVGSLAWSGLCPQPGAAQDYEVYPMEARVWLDRGAEPVLQKGGRARVYYRVSESAFVAIFHIDTNGTIRMVFPSSPQESHYARGGRDYRVLFPGSSYWYVGDDPGMGYFFIVASPEPFDFRDFGYSHFVGGWDLNGVGRQVYGDPYLAMDDYVAALVPDWEYVPYGLDFTSYHVERRHEYPRFLCYDCHPFQPYYSWNPYTYSCTSFRVVIYSDPYYYPATRYRGTRVVYVQPRRGVAHFGFKERAAGEAGTPHVVVRNTPPVRQPGVDGTANRRAVPRTGPPSAFSPGKTSGTSSGRVGGARSGVEGTANRRSGGNGTSAAVPRTTQPPRNPVTRPSSGVRSTSTGSRASSSTRAATRSGGTSGRTTGTVRSGGTTTRSTGTVRSGGTPTQRNPIVRSGGNTNRTTPTTRSRSNPTQRSPTVRSGGNTNTRSRVTTRPRTSTTRSGGTPAKRIPTVRSGGTGKTAPARTTRPPPKPKVKRRTGGGG